MRIVIGRWTAACGVIFVTGVFSAQGAAQSGAAGAATPTFSRDVAPVFYKHCTSCHRPGEIGPMSLLTYEEARPYARAIRDRVANGVMPPWHADPAYGTWVNDRRLSAEEKDVIVRWAAGGTPQGDPKDLPAQPVYTPGWQIGQPDAIITMPTAFNVPAEGVIPYRYFEAATNFTEDKWVEAFEIRPGNRAAVHHVLVYARHPGMETRPQIARSRNPTGGLTPTLQREAPATPAQTQTGQPRAAQPQQDRRGPLLAGSAPGVPPAVFEPGSAVLIKAGSILTFQIHYTTNGQAAPDQTSIGFRFAAGPVTSEVRTMAMMNPRLNIPAGASNHPVEAAMEFTEDVTLYGLVPHTHLRGKSWEHRLVYPDGREEIILAVPKYDFNWQTEYVFAEPLKVPKGSVLKGLAHYDNSAANKSNPDPTKNVTWGDQTWEEMQYTSITFSVDKERIAR